MQDKISVEINSYNQRWKKTALDSSSSKSPSLILKQPKRTSKASTCDDEGCRVTGKGLNDIKRPFSLAYTTTNLMSNHGKNVIINADEIYPTQATPTWLSMNNKKISTSGIIVTQSLLQKIHKYS